MKHKLLSLIFVLTCIVGVAFAQNRQVSGKVTSVTDGAPLGGVSVLVVGTSSATQTDGSGNYSISVEGNATLNFSFVGYASKRVSVGSNTTVNVQLETDETSLEEVVVTGYGVRLIKDLTGSQSRVSGDKLAKEPSLSFDQALSGKMAGVQVGSSGGTLGDGVSVRIRGINSISSSSLPLYIIDGVPMNTVENTNVFNSGNGTRFNPLAMINSNDIESIEVLKDASAAVLYGSRAANGVILINTKRGKKGTTNIAFDSKTTFSRPAKMLDMLGAEDFMKISNEKISNASKYFSGVTEIAKESDVDGDGVNDRTNWLDEVYRNGIGYDNSVSISGGQEKANYFGSVRYLDQKGILENNSLKTGQVRLNTDINPLKWLKTGISLSYSKTLNNGVLTDRYVNGVTVSALQAFPTMAFSNPATSTGYNLGSNGYLTYGNNTRVVNGTNLVGGNIAHPYAASALQLNQNTPEQLLGNVYAEISPIQGLKISTKYGIDYLNNYEHQYAHPLIGGLGMSYNGMVQDNIRYRNQWVWQNYANYDRQFGVHRISATLGMESQFTKEKQVYAGGNDFSDTFFTDLIDGTYTGSVPGTSDVMLWSGGTLFSTGLQSYFGRVGYVFNDKYLAEVAFRSDAFSGFGLNSRWGSFPSMSLGWVASNEDFLKDVEWLNYLKVRGSYGKVGNSRGVGAYAARTLYGGGAYTTLNGFSASQMGNADLRWESSTKLDVGVDFTILNDRLNFVVDYYKNDISGLILNANPPSTVGVPGGAIETNIGSMKNSGIEFSVNAKTMTRENFTWNTSLNFTTVNNEVTSLVTEGADMVDGFSVASVGRRLGTYKLIKWRGVDSQTGDPMWYTADGGYKTYNQADKSWTYTNTDGVTTAAGSGVGGGDAQYLDESGLPKYYGGLDNNFTYKNIDFGFSMVYTGGFSIYNSTRASLLSNYFVNNGSEILDRWTTPGQQTDVPKLYMTETTANQASTRFLEKGDFLRMRTISLGYTFNDLSRWGISSLRLYGQVYNAFVITGYTGQDPEVSLNRNNSNIAIGVDNRSVPQPRTYTLGLNISLQ